MKLSTITTAVGENVEKHKGKVSIGAALLILVPSVLSWYDNHWENQSRASDHDLLIRLDEKVKDLVSAQNAWRGTNWIRVARSQPSEVQSANQIPTEKK